MRKTALIFVLLSLFVSAPLFASYAEARTVKKQTTASVKTAKKQHGVKTKKAKVSNKRSKKVVYKRPRYANNVNKPQEGEVLKLEGMVKDINEQ